MTISSKYHLISDMIMDFEQFKEMFMHSDKIEIYSYIIDRIENPFGTPQSNTFFFGIRDINMLRMRHSPSTVKRICIEEYKHYVSQLLEYRIQEVEKMDDRKVPYNPPPERWKEWEDAVRFCKDRIDELEDWELGIIDSCDQRLSSRIPLSFRQSKWLRIIFNKLL